MKKIACILLAAVTLWFVIVFLANGMAKITMSASSRAYSWVSKEKLRSLARYHGTDAVKITELEVFIWRGGGWIPVLKKKQIGRVPHRLSRPPPLSTNILFLP